MTVYITETLKYDCTCKKCIHLHPLEYNPVHYQVPLPPVCSESTHQQDNAEEVVHDDLRPTTPLETSEREPSLSKSSGGGSIGHAHSPPTTTLGGTYRIGDADAIIGMGGVRGVAAKQIEELELLNESALESKKQLSSAEEKLSRAQEEHRNLNLKIRYIFHNSAHYEQSGGWI